MTRIAGARTIVYSICERIINMQHRARSIHSDKCAVRKNADRSCLLAHSHEGSVDIDWVPNLYPGMPQGRRLRIRDRSQARISDQLVSQSANSILDNGKVAVSGMRMK